MMQVYIDAITTSRTGETQYVLQKGLRIERTYERGHVLHKLKTGWDLVGKFINGTGYDIYTICNEQEINILNSFLENQIGHAKSGCSMIDLSFQEFFGKDYESEDINVDITFFDEKMNYENFRVSGEKAKDIRDFLVFNLFTKQNKQRLITLFERMGINAAER